MRIRAIVIAAAMVAMLACERAVEFKYIDRPVYVDLGETRIQPELYWGLWLEAEYAEGGLGIDVRGSGWVLNTSDEAVELRMRPVWVCFTNPMQPKETTLLRLVGRFWGLSGDTTEVRALAAHETAIVGTEWGRLYGPAYWGITWQ